MSSTACRTDATEACVGSFSGLAKPSSSSMFQNIVQRDGNEWWVSSSIAYGNGKSKADLKQSKQSDIWIRFYFSSVVVVASMIEI